MVEVNNESSLMQAWQWGQLDPVLRGEYHDALGSQWNRWLGAKYGSTSALATAWGDGAPDGPNLLNGQWRIENTHGKAGTLSMTTTDGIATAQIVPGAYSGTGNGWLYLKQTGFQVTAGVRYVWRFEARADLGAGQRSTCLCLSCAT